MNDVKQATQAATEIFEKYERYLGAENMGNQDRDCCIQTISEIVEKHCGGTPAFMSEALNSGDGTYKP